MSARVTIAAVTACFVSLAATQPPKPKVKLTAPRIVLANIDRPTEVLVRVKLIDAPECFGLVIAWGDGESSAWETCDETSWSKTHRYKVRETEVVIVAALFVAGKTVAWDQTTLELR